MTTQPSTPPAATDTSVVDPAPRPHATAEEVEAARKDTKLAQVLYHDWEAETYDDKWSISYDERCIDYARGRFDAVAGDQPLPYERALELGCGTGFFLLNLMQGGVAKTGSVTDLSPGMVKVALRNAESLGLPVDGRVADAETIPYEDNTFDLVVGHAVLHHIPDVEKSLREVLRVLKPGGRFVFAGEPTTVGNFYARWLGRATWEATTRVTKLPFLADWRRPQEELVRVFSCSSSRGCRRHPHVRPHRPREHGEVCGRRSGSTLPPRNSPRRFSAGLSVLSEAAVPPEKLGWGWGRFAFGGWKTLSWVDEKVLRHVVPRGFFYNVMITGVKPGN